MPTGTPEESADIQTNVLTTSGEPGQRESASETPGGQGARPLLSLQWHRWLQRDCPLDRSLHPLFPAREQLRLLEAGLLDRTGLRQRLLQLGGPGDLAIRLTVHPEDARAPLRRDFVRARLKVAIAAEAAGTDDDEDGDFLGNSGKLSAQLLQVDDYVIFAYSPEVPRKQCQQVVAVLAADLARLTADSCTAIGLSVHVTVDAAPGCSVRVTADVRTVLRCLSGCQFTTRGSRCHGNKSVARDDASKETGICPALRRLRSVVLQEEEEEEEAAVDGLACPAGQLELRYCHSRRLVELFLAP